MKGASIEGEAGAHREAEKLVSGHREDLAASNPSGASGGRGEEDELDPKIVVLPGMWPSAWRRRVMQRSF